MKGKLEIKKDFQALRQFRHDLVMLECYSREDVTKAVKEDDLVWAPLDGFFCHSWPALWEAGKPRTLCIMHGVFLNSTGALSEHGSTFYIIHNAWTCPLIRCITSTDLCMFLWKDFPGNDSPTSRTRACLANSVYCSAQRHGDFSSVFQISIQAESLWAKTEKAEWGWYRLAANLTALVWSAGQNTECFQHLVEYKSDIIGLP